MLQVFLLLTFLISCKKKYEGDVRYLPEDWDNVTLVDSNNQSFSLSNLRGKHKVIYFGFSHCPDMCPMALTNLSQALLILGPKANKLESVFITLDPDRDSPDQMKRYIEMFKGQKFIALTPTNDSLDKLFATFNIRREKKENGNSYTFDHSNFIFFIGEKNEQIATYPGSTTPETLAKELRELLP
ncbi:MAG: SCO family protein [Chitinophagaceae bacterium]|nr:SCO family protein [Chitinophagaceae bacterium]